MKRKILTILAYTLLVALVLFASTCEGSVELTTPERDAMRLEMMAKTVRSEAELRDVERLAMKYEIAYAKAYNGATALHFKALVEPILIEAGHSRDEIRAEEDYLSLAEHSVRDALDVMERAWRMELISIEASRADIASIEERVRQTEEEYATMNVKKEQLAMDIIEQGYPESLLTELGEIEEQLKVKLNDIEQLHHEIEVIVLAYRLQQNVDILPVAEIDDMECEGEESNLDDELIY